MVVEIPQHLEISKIQVAKRPEEALETPLFCLLKVEALERTAGSRLRKKKPPTFAGGLIYSEIFYNSKAFLTSPFINNSVGFSKASFMATKNPTDSRPSIILWS